MADRLNTPLEGLLDELNSLDAGLNELHSRRNTVIDQINEHMLHANEALRKSTAYTTGILIADSPYNPQTEEKAEEGDVYDVEPAIATTKQRNRKY